MPSGHRPGVPPEVDLEDKLDRAFESADPETAYFVAVEILKAYQAEALESSKLRYRLNFGTPVCDSCEGLRAGAGVAATCFQTKRCNYTNVKEGDATPRHLRVIRSLLDPKQSP